MIVKLSFLVIHYHYHPYRFRRCHHRLSGFSHFWQCLMHWLTVSVIVFTSESLLIFVWPVYTCTLYYHTANQAQISRMHKLKVTTKCFIDYLLVTEVSAPIPGIICFSKGSPKGISCVSRDSIGFPKEIFGSPKGVSQIRISLRFARWCMWTNSRCFAAQIAPSSPPIEVKHLGSMWVFLVEILSKPSNNGSKNSVLENIGRARCLKAVPGYWCKITKHIVDKFSYL